MVRFLMKQTLLKNSANCFKMTQKGDLTFKAEFHLEKSNLFTSLSSIKKSETEKTENMHKY